MTNQKMLPVFCDHCNTLAVAELEGAPMCIECLVTEIDRQENKRDSFTEIKPLSVAPPAVPTTGILAHGDMSEPPESSNVA